MSSNTNPIAASARALFRQSKLAAAASASSSTAAAPAARIHHPFASYDHQGRLKCNLCDSIIKSVAGWKAHLASAEHKAAISQRQHASVTNPAVKRKLPDSGGGDQGGDGAEGPSRGNKVAKTSTSSSPASLGRATGAAAPLAAAYVSSDDDEDNDSGERDSHKMGQDMTHDSDADSDTNGALPAGFFDSDQGSDSDDSERGPDRLSATFTPDTLMPHNATESSKLRDDDADLLAYDVPDTDPTVFPSNLAAAMLDAQLDDPLDDTSNGGSHLQAGQGKGEVAEDPDSALFASLTAERAHAESQTQSELVERLRRLHTQRGHSAGAAMGEESEEESSDGESAAGVNAASQGDKGEEGGGNDDAFDNDDDNDEEEADWSWRVRGIQGARK